MVSEYACIIIAFATVLLYQPHRLFFNYGFTPGRAVDVLELLLGTCLQLFAELLVDLLCIRVEEKEGIPVLGAWLQVGVGSGPEGAAPHGRTFGKGGEGGGDGGGGLGGWFPQRDALEDRVAR